MEKWKVEMAVDNCLVAGRLMMESGAETYRVEDTMTRMATAQGLIDAQAFVIPTGIMLFIGKEQAAQLMLIKDRGTDLGKIASINQVSRMLADNELTIEQVKEQLQLISRQKVNYPLFVQIISAAIASGSFLLLFGGTWYDIPAAMLAGGAGFLVVTRMQEWTKVKFFAEFFAALIVGLIAYFAIYLSLGKNVDTIIIGGVMPLVPGLLITNAIRDLMAGHFVSGLSKGAEAFLTAFAIGAGIASILSFVGGL